MDGDASPNGDAEGTPTQTAFQLAEPFADLLLKLDDQHRVVMVDGLEETVGHNGGAVLGEPITDLIANQETLQGRASTEETASVQKLLEENQDGRKAVIPFKTADGSVRPITLSVTPRDGGGYLCAGQKRMEQPRGSDRTLSERQYDEFLETVGDPMYVLDARDHIERINDAMLEYTGYDRDELLGRTIAELIHPGEYEQAVQSLTEPPVAGRESTTFETTLVTKNGEVVVTEASVTVLGQDERHTGSVGVLRDVSERNEREQNLEALKEVFTRILRHNVRNELTVMQGYAEVLEEELKGEQNSHAEKILNRANRLYDQTEKARLLEEALNAERQVDIDLARTVDRIVEEIRTENPEADIDVNMPDGRHVNGHSHVNTALQELLLNAIEHAEEQPRVRIWLDENEDFVTIFVEDESGGLSDTELELLRTGTETELKHGSGVGLWLIRWIVELSDAKIVAHRTEQGTLMGLRFPHPDSSHRSERLHGSESPVTRAPSHVRESPTEQFQGDAVIERIDELHELENVYDAVERRGGHAVLVTGESGVGKTTLVKQFCQRLGSREQPPVIGTGSCEAGTTPPYAVFREAMDDLPVAAETEAMLAEMATFDDDDPDTVRQRRQSLFADVAEELKRLALDRPVVLCVEDLHSAEKETVSLFEYLIEEVGQWAPAVLFVGTYRVEDVDGNHPILTVAAETAETGRGTVLELDPFNEEDVGALLSEMFETQQLPAEFVTAVSDHTGGRPQFVAEIGHRLAETVGSRPTSAELTAAFDGLSLPETIESAVTERLDRLSPPAASLLEVGAVFGQTATFNEVREVSDLSEGELVSAVEELLQQRLWDRDGDTLAFIHGVIQKTVYSRIDDDRRQTLHRKIGAAIESQSDTLEDHYSRLGTHYEAAGETGTAIEYYRKAGENAANLYAHETALENYEQALSLTDSEATSPVATLRANVAEVQRSKGALEAAMETVDAGLPTAESDPAERYRLLATKCGIQIDRGSFEPARETARQLRALAGEIETPSLEASVSNLSARIAGRHGNYEQAEEFYDHALSLGQQVDDPEIKSSALSGLGGVAFFSGDFETAYEYLEKATAVANEVGDRQTQASNHNNLGEITRRWGEYERAKGHYQETLRISEEIEYQQREGLAAINLAEIHLLQGDFEAARGSARRGLETMRAIGDRQMEASSLNVLGQIALSESDFERAREFFEDALAVAREIGHPNREGRALLGLGMIARKTGDGDEAIAKQEHAKKLFEQSGHEMKLARVELELARTRLERGETETAQEHAESACDRFQRLDAAHWHARSQKLLGQVHARAGNSRRARENWTAAVEAFETVGASQDTLQTLQYLYDQYDEGDQSEWCQRAESALEKAPAPIESKHQDWVVRASESGGND